MLHDNGRAGNLERTAVIASHVEHGQSVAILSVDLDGLPCDVPLFEPSGVVRVSIFVLLRLGERCAAKGNQSESFGKHIYCFNLWWINYQL